MNDFSLFWIIIAEFIVGLIFVCAVIGIFMILWMIIAFVVDTKREHKRLKERRL
jgi:hypothetical protein